MVSMKSEEELKVSASYHPKKRRDLSGTFLESKHVGFDNPVYAFRKDPKLTEFVIEVGGKQEKSKQCGDTWDIQDHQIPIEILFKRFGTHPDRGLTDDQVKKNREKYGRNIVTPPKKPSEFIKFWKNVFFGLNLLLWVCGGVNIGTYIVERITTDKQDQGNLNSGIVLILVVFISGSFSYYQQYKSSQIFRSFRKAAPHRAVVWRNAKRMEIDGKDIVVGDVIEVKYGDKIPADIRIIESQGLKVDNCLLSGESQPQNRRPTFTDRDPLSTKNLIFFTTNATEGSAKGVVIRVGEQTYMGKLASLANSMNASDTPLAVEMQRIVRLITSTSAGFGLIFFLVALAMDYPLIDSLFFVCGIVVANVPENLSITLTIQLALVAKKMAEKHCMIKHLHAVETLGCASVICTDKTGTLTQNKMAVAHLWFNCNLVDPFAPFIDGIPLKNKPTVHLDINDPAYNSVINVATLCSRAKFKPGQDHMPVLAREVEGDGSEAAILKYVESQLGNSMQYRDRHPKVCEIPFNSVNKYQVSIHDMKDPRDSRYLLVMKGAPERVMSMCTTILIDNEEHDLDDLWRRKIYDASVKLGKLGERVLGFCDRRLRLDKFPRYHLFDSENPDFLNEGFRFVGLISLIDPPRPSVPGAIAKCKSAGIQVVMITNEHPITAWAIGQAVGIISEEPAASKRLYLDSLKETVLSMSINPQPYRRSPGPVRRVKARTILGQELDVMSPEELDSILSQHKEVVFARTTPKQKHLIVESFQRLGHVVAITGDKVNDTPALKRADVGIAMGTGADVAKEVSDMVLMDNNFASIVSGIEEGRLLFDNLKKLVRFTLADNIAMMYTFWIFIIFNIPLPIDPLTMIISVMCIDSLPAISLAHESPAMDLMKLPPRNLQRDTLVTQYTLSYSYGQISIIEVTCAMCSFFVTMAYNGFLPGRILYIQREWNNRAINDLEDSYGQEWTFYSRRELLYAAQTAFLIGIVVCQWANAIACKTRRLSIFQKGMQNGLMNIALIVAPGLLVFVTYTPVVNRILNFRPVSYGPWCAALPFALLIFVYDELRRLAVRKYQGGWVTNEFYR